MTSQSLSPQPPGISLGDIYYVLFRHKWKIILCSVLGFAITGALYKLDAPLYRSEAKLFVRYIISETGGTGPNSDATAKLPDQRGTSIMNTEKEILSSENLVRQVVANLGAEKILAAAGGGTNPGDAINLLRSNLSVSVPPSSSVVSIVIKHPDAEIVQPALNEVIATYFKMHHEAHRSAGGLGNTLEQEADALKLKLRRTEDDLRNEMAKIGVVSLDEAKKDLSARRAETLRGIRNQETELAVINAVLEQHSRPSVVTTPSSPAEMPPPPPREILDQYRTVSGRIERGRRDEEALLLQFTPENARIKDARAQLAAAERERKELEEQYPALKPLVAPATPQGGIGPETVPSAGALLQITAHQTRITTLNSQFEQMGEELKKLDRAEGRIVELMRQKELDEAHSRYYQTRLEQSKINDTLGTGKVSGIIPIQSPSQAYRERPTKKLGAPAISGILVGLAWAFLIELYLDRSVRRPSDIEKTLRVPLFLSIPKLRLNGARDRRTKAQRQLALGSSDPSGGNLPDSGTGSALRKSEDNNPLSPFHETLRDKLIGYFETNNLSHKPKLIAITGLGPDAGVTTTAGGLARSLSETGAGNVLLVDMTVGQGAAQQFVKGKAVCGLDELLNARDQAQVDTNLYVVAENSNSDRLSRNLPLRFTKLVPQLKSSDFDYVIFDMPPVNQLSITTRLAGFMDMVLLVVESEKNDRDIVQQATALLAESKAHVGIVLNKTNNYVPARLNQEFLHS